MIELKSVSFRYGLNLALDDISFQVSEGEKVVLIGVNGCGKSTLLKLIAGLIFPQKGEYTFRGKLISRDSLKDKEFNLKFRKEVSMMFQNTDLMLFNPTVYDEIAFGLRQFELGDIEDRVRYWAQLFNLTKLLDKSPFELSGGEKQKVCLASLLAVEPSLLLLDEPTSNLDPRTTGWLVEFLQDLNITLLTTTHNLSLAAELGSRGIVLSEDHKVIYDGNVEELIKNEELLIRANLVHKHLHKHRNTFHSHFHLHSWD